MAIPPVQLFSQQPGGGIVTAGRGINALRASDLENKMNELKNQYYAPNIESEIAQRQALTKGYNIANEYAPERLRLANELSKQNLEWNPRKWQSEIENRNALTQGYNINNVFSPERLKLANEHQTQINSLYPELTKAQINAQNALSNYRELGGAGMGVGQKELNGFQRQLQLEHPDWTPQMVNQAASSYLAGESNLPTGEQLPSLSGLGQTYIAQIQRRNAPVAVQNQAAQMDILYDELNNFNINAVKQFAGPQGKIRLAQAKLKMATNPNDPNIDPQAREFISAMNQAIINMDAMRKAFGTSIVPDYVYATLGKLTNPADSIWNDPNQVAKNYETVLNSIKRTRDMISKKAKYGATYQSNEKEKKSNAKWIYNQQTGKLEPK